jgi:hypothetical protein
VRPPATLAPHLVRRADLTAAPIAPPRRNGAICVTPSTSNAQKGGAQIRRSLESGYAIACGCGDSSSWTCPRPSSRRSPRTLKAQRRKDSRSVSRQGRGSRERVHDDPTRREKRRRGRAKSAREYRRYTGDRRSPSPSGRITPDTRVILADLSNEYAEMITRVSLDLDGCDTPRAWLYLWLWSRPLPLIGEGAMRRITSLTDTSCTCRPATGPVRAARPTMLARQGSAVIVRRSRSFP